MDYKNIIKHAFTMPYDTQKLQLVTRVTICHSESEIAVLALWDTGATGTCISEIVAEQLGLVSVGKRTISTPSGQSEVDTYLLDVVLPNNVRIPDVCVTETKIHLQGFGALIGMDIITRGDLTVNCFQGKTSFTFRIPSIERADYVKEIRIENAIGPRHGKGKRQKRKKK